MVGDEPGMLFTTKDQCKEARDRINVQARIIAFDENLPRDPPTQAIPQEIMDKACEPKHMAWLVGDKDYTLLNIIR